MRLPLLSLLLLALPAAAQVFPYGGGGVCTLDGTSAALAPYYRATTATDTVPAFGCDAVLSQCVKYGPGIDTGCGTNVLGEVVCGRTGQTSGVWRYWGTMYANGMSAVNVTATNVATYNAALDQGNTAFMRNTFANRPVKVDDGEGLLLTCKATLPTCGTVPEGTVLPVCATGGALTQACMCVTDGVTPHWRNLLNPAAGGGTSTTCPAT